MKRILGFLPDADERLSNDAVDKDGNSDAADNAAAPLSTCLLVTPTGEDPEIKSSDSVLDSTLSMSFFLFIFLAFLDVTD
jgi:hypothetical protein